jgi:dephospho-CoA kinase
MLLLGLTGSIATGKSTVSSLLSSPPYSLPLIDADLLARQVVEPGTYGYRQVVSTFGPSTPDLLLPADDPKFPDTGKGRWLNRPALGRRVFGEDPERVEARRKLGRIIHPLVRLGMLRAVLWHFLKGESVLVLDVPLLFEGGLDMFCGAVVVVGVSDPKIQMERLRARDPHLSAEDAENRVRSQGNVLDKCRRVTERNAGSEKDKGGEDGRGYVIWNDGDKEELKREVARVMEKVRKRSPRWWSWLLLFCPPGMAAVGIWTVLRNYLDRRRWVKREGEKRAKL